MNERDIFIAALEKATAEERSEFLSATCGGDSQLRERVEGLLQTHEQTGDFLQKPLVERLSEGVAALEEAAETARNPSTSRKSGGDLGFLSPSEQPGSLGKLGHYEVQEVIGSGGMGIVLRAFDERLHRMVAIKVMAATLATNAAARKRFQREARAAAAVCHDHIVTIHAVEESGDLPYLVMQFVAGMSLQQRIDRDGPLALHEILRIGMQTAAGLAAAHAQGLIHRDVKPANILLENGVERVKITDFGLARAAADASVSQTGIVAGTPKYMAPEQARGEALDCRTDLFSLGSVLYAMCSGRAPFRAANSMAVLKRVCEEAPSPIHEANADVPEWLIEVIDKLQAKNPIDRYQSAAEVADLLGRRLAQLQHSTPLPALTSAKLAPAKPAPSRRAAQRLRTWAVAAAVLLAVLAMFAIAEGTGVTQVAATVIRLMTPGGVLVVETDDPAVKVTIEGDGGLVITGAGPHEVRLKPGSYKLQADKNGQAVKLDQELVTITRGGKEVVRVRMETPATSAAATPKEEHGAFVRMGGKEVAERKFDTLAEAVESASGGDTIEIRGNGPFVSQPINISGTALTIRAGEGFRPVIQLSSNLQTDAPLVLEGLELQHLRQQAPEGWGDALVLSSGNRLHVANCRFREHLAIPSIVAGIPRCFVRNCEFLNPHQFALVWSGKECAIDNCLIAGQALQLENGVGPGPDDGRSVELTRNTLSAANPLFCRVYPNVQTKLPQGDVKPIRVEASGNIFDANQVLVLSVAPPFVKNEKPLEPKEAAALLPHFLNWRDRLNLYAPGVRFVSGYTDPVMTIGGNNLADWKRFWDPPEGEAIEGRVLYQGGNLVAKLNAIPEKLTPDDFRLRADSAGYKAGKDLGADVDLVGPGPAYERWKKTPEYQQWLEDTGQPK